MSRNKFRTLAAMLVLGWSAAAHAADGKPLSIGLVDAIAAAPLYIGSANGDFADAGLDASLKPLDQPSAVAEAVADGRLDVGAAALTPSFLAFAAQHDLKIIAPEVSDKTGFPATGLLFSKKAGYRGVKLLPGARIALTPATIALRYDFSRIAARYRFAPDAIKAVSMETQDQALAALAAGTVDAVAMPYIAALQLQAKGTGASVLRTSDFTEAQRGVIFTRASEITNDRAKIDAFMHGYERAAARYDQVFQQRDDEGAILPGPHFRDGIALIAQHAHADAPTLQSALPYCDHLARLDLEDIQRQLAFWQANGTVGASVTAASLVDLSFNPHRLGS